jgi:dTDP-4-amino-4,6-dideoxygalactose transaminase
MKTGIGDFAIFGGAPDFSNVLHVGRPNIPDREQLMERINDILDRRWLTNQGRYVREFEQRVAECMGVKHCICMCNGTIAMEIAIRALGMTGEVIVPSFTFVATAHALQWQEITPVFCDIDPRTHNIDPVAVEKHITPLTTGIIAVHLWGRPCDVDALTEIAERHGLRLLFDAAHAFGCSYKGRLIGGFGDAEVFSFHATKFVNTFEGGAVVTNNEELAQKIRLMKNFGFAGLDNVIHLGTNGKMCEVSAAMGLASMEEMESFISRNKQNYHTYRSGLADIPGITLINYDESEKENFQYIVIEVDADKTSLGRDTLMEILHAENIRARRYFYPGVHRMEPYRSHYPDAGKMLPETEKLAGKVLCLPTGTTVNHEDIEKVCNIIRLAVNNGSVLSARLAQKNSAGL